jgi:hypothetical protein
MNIVQIVNLLSLQPHLSSEREKEESFERKI